MLHTTAPQVSLDGTGRGIGPTRGPFHATPALLLAELAVLGQAALGIVTGLNLIRGATSLTQLGTGVNLTLSSDVTSRFGIGILVIAVLLIVLVGVATIPSQLARALLAVLEVFALGATLAAHFGGGSVLGFITVLVMGTAGSALVPFGVVIGIEAGLVYLLAIHPATYRAFSR